MKIYPNQDLQHQDCGCPVPLPYYCCIPGPRGPQGPTGMGETIAIRNTITGEPGTEARVYDITCLLYTSCRGQQIKNTFEEA